MKHLLGTQASGALLNHPVAQFEIGNYKNFVYLILDWDQKKAAIIDPQSDLSEPLSVIQKHGFKLESILLTHTHSDHTAGVPQLLREHSDIKVYVHCQDTHRLPLHLFGPGQQTLVTHDQTIQIGDLRVKVLHTPGHSAGECCYFLEAEPPYLFTGDTIFIRDCGRTDLESGSNEEMFKSLQRVRALPKETIILPGHHYKPECSSTLGKEIQESPPFQCKTVKELAALP